MDLFFTMLYIHSDHLINQTLGVVPVMSIQLKSCDLKNHLYLEGEGRLLVLHEPVGGQGLLLKASLTVPVNVKMNYVKWQLFELESL